MLVKTVNTLGMRSHKRHISFLISIPAYIPFSNVDTRRRTVVSPEEASSGSFLPCSAYLHQPEESRQAKRCVSVALYLSQLF
jgi:hypothetical protein